MTTEPQYPRSEIEANIRAVDAYVRDAYAKLPQMTDEPFPRPAAPVAQEPPAPTLGMMSIEGVRSAAETGGSVLGSGPDPVDGMWADKPAAGSAQEPATGKCQDCGHAEAVHNYAGCQEWLDVLRRTACGCAQKPASLHHDGGIYTGEPLDPASSAQEPADPPMTDYRLARIRARLHDDKESMITTADELGDWHMVLSEGGLTGVVIDSHDRPRLVCEGEDGVLYVTSVGGEDGDPPWDKAVMELWAYGPFRVIWPVQS